MSLSAALAQWRETGQYVTVQPLNLKVFCVDLGDASASSDETCMLLHGFPESSFSYHKVVGGLQQRFKRIVLLDLPGYGFSDKPASEYSYSLIAQADVACCVWRELGVRGGHLIAHDMGTSVQTELICRQTNALLPAFLTDGFLSATFTNGSMVLTLAKLRLMQKLLLSKRVGALVSSLARFSMFERTLLSAHGGTGKHTLSEQDIAGLWQSVCLQQGHKKNHHIIRYLNDRKRYERTRWLPSLAIASESIPIHLCWGTADRVAVVAMAHYLKENVCTRASLTEMVGAGHFCQLGSPSLWLESVLSFYQAKPFIRHD